MWIYTYEGEKEAVDKERIMKILAGIITIAGIVVLAFLILDNKAEQRKVQQVAAEDEKKTQSLEYIEMEELENQDKEKQKELKAKANGNQDILITIRLCFQLFLLFLILVLQFFHLYIFQTLCLLFILSSYLLNLTLFCLIIQNQESQHNYTGYGNDTC